jgi:hypothetical protein
VPVRMPAGSLFVFGSYLAHRSGSQFQSQATRFDLRGGELAKPVAHSDSRNTTASRRMISTTRTRHTDARLGRGHSRGFQGWIIQSAPSPAEPLLPSRSASAHVFAVIDGQPGLAHHWDKVLAHHLEPAPSGFQPR